MSIRDNVRFNRTKMLDEAAINHRPTHFLYSLLFFMIVYFVADTARQSIMLLPTMIYLFSTSEFKSLLGQASSGEMDMEALMESYSSVLSDIASNIPWWLVLISLVSTVALAICAILYCKIFEKRKLPTLGLRKSNIALEYGVGAIIGLAMYSLAFLIAFLTGSVKFEGGASFSFPIILFFLAFIIQGASEEIFIRGYLMTSVARDYKVFLAVFFSSAVFSLIHISNAGVTVLALINIFLFGVFEGIYVLKRGDLWGACAIHSMWNFAQGNIFGSSVSGMGQMPSIFRVVSNPNMTAANGGAFGIEGGFACTIVVLVAIGIILLIPPKKSELPDYELFRAEFNEEK
ncbi:MAG: CPBP family intramembrane metalloprotease [Ruminococcaceae bacterium]|nr:CPBP family intramembrane metalloprotease [Oscillospiraceae bacterium]